MSWGCSVKRQNNCANHGTKLFLKNITCAVNGTASIIFVPQNSMFGTKILWKCVLRRSTDVNHCEPQVAHKSFKNFINSFFIFNANIMIIMKLAFMHLRCDVCGSSKEIKTILLIKKDGEVNSIKHRYT